MCSKNISLLIHACMFKRRHHALSPLQFPRFFPCQFQQLRHERLVQIILAHGGVQSARHAVFRQRTRDIIVAVFHLANDPVGQDRDPAVGSDKQQDHRREFNLTDGKRLDLGGNQQLAEHVKACAFHRLGNQRFASEIRGLDIWFGRKGVMAGGDKHRLVIEQFNKLDAGQVLGIR